MVPSATSRFLPRGAHIGHLFSALSEQQDVAVSFIRDGLRAGEHCFFTVCDRTADEWYADLANGGIDVEAARASGALVVIEEEKVRPAGEFNAIRLGHDLWGMVQGQLQRFSGVRLARELPWAEGAALSTVDLCHMEAAATLLFADSPVRLLCQYNLGRHPPASIHTALRCHPWLIVEGRLHSNPFCEVPEILRGEPEQFASTADDAFVRDLLSHFSNA